MLKVERNFKCNGVKKEKGQKLSESEEKLIGEKIGELINNGILLRIEEQKPAKKAPKKQAKKSEVKED